MVALAPDTTRMRPGSSQVKGFLLSGRFIRLLGVGLFVIILAKLDIAAIVSMTARAHSAYLLCAVGLFPVFIGLKALRWQYLMKMQGIHYRLKDSLLAYFSGIYLGVITPGRFGEFLKAVYVSNERKIGLARSVSSVVFDRLMDLFVLAAVACLGMVVFSGSPTLVSLSVLTVSMVMAAAALAFSHRIGSWLITACDDVLISPEMAERVRGHLGDFYEGIRELRQSQLVVPLLLSLAGIGTFYSLCYIIAVSLSINISPLYLACCISIASIASLLPISISGIGIRDLILIGLFGSIGLSAETALSFSVTFLLYFTGSSALFGFLAWLIKPLEFRDSYGGSQVNVRSTCAQNSAPGESAP